MSVFSEILIEMGQKRSEIRLSKIIEMNERCRVLIAEQIYSSHKYEFAVNASQFRFITIDLTARAARAHYHSRGH